MTRAGQRGSGLVELLVASVIVLAAAAALSFELRAASNHVRVSAEAVDVSARLQSTVDTLLLAIGQSGTGLVPIASDGALPVTFPAVWPSRVAVRDADPELTAFDDRISVLTGGASRRQAALAQAMPNPWAPVSVAPLPGCPALDAVCGFRTGDLALVADQRGHTDLLRVASTTGGVLSHDPAMLSHAYDPHDHVRIVPVEPRAFVFDPSGAVLREYRGRSAALPLVDHIVDFRLELLGEPDPHALPRPPAGESTCAFRADGSSTLSTLPRSRGPWAVIPPAVLGDGPSCGVAPFRFDADLLRVRAVRLVVRAEASDAGVRGTDPQLFRRPGRARDGAVVVDREVSLDVWLRQVPGA